MCPWTIRDMRATLIFLQTGLPKEFCYREEFRIRDTAFDPVELARYEKAKRQPNKAESLYPTWLKKHISKRIIPSREEIDYRMRLPRAGSNNFGSFYFVNS